MLLYNVMWGVKWAKRTILGVICEQLLSSSAESVSSIDTECATAYWTFILAFL